MKGMLIHVLRTTLGDCTNGGVSSKSDSFVLIGKGVPEIFEPSEKNPALYLFRWYGITGCAPEDVEAKFPPRKDQRGDCSISHLGGWMAGGNYASTCDSRMKDVLGHYYPIPIYDRKE